MEKKNDQLGERPETTGWADPAQARDVLLGRNAPASGTDDEDRDGFRSRPVSPLKGEPPMKT